MSAVSRSPHGADRSGGGHPTDAHPAASEAGLGAADLPGGEAALMRLRADAPRVEARYAEFVARGLNLDMTRGKPSADQLALSNGLLATVGPEDFRSPDGTDCRNYGGLEGLPALRGLLGALFGAPAAQTLVGNNASLEWMHDSLVRALLHGVPGGSAPWSAGVGGEPIRWLCPVPGYDRHFAICAHFGVEMVPVPEGPEGPDLAAVAALVAADARIKGMWLVPRYANPTGVVCSDAVIAGLAAMPTAAPDFRIFCDDAYAEHHLVETPQPRRHLLEACAAAGHPDRVLVFGSTSKITFAGGGVSVFCASPANVAWTLKHAGVRTIGPDKLNQLRHLRFLPTVEALQAHMRGHAALLRPRFAAVLAGLEAELDGLARWSRPEGGYFVSVDTPNGCAARTVALAAAAGVKLTPAGATYPYGRDPLDRNIRLAPSLPPVAELVVATELFGVCVQKAALERLG